MLDEHDDTTNPDLPAIQLPEARFRVLAIAHGELGNQDPSKYWLDAFGSVPKGHYAWCGVFALWCLRQAALTQVLWSIASHKPGFCFRLHQTGVPEPGDVAYFSLPYQHHALVTRREDDTLWLVQGNYGTPGHVAESQVSITQKRPTFYSIDCLLPVEAL